MTRLERRMIGETTRSVTKAVEPLTLVAVSRAVSAIVRVLSSTSFSLVVAWSILGITALRQPVDPVHDVEEGEQHAHCQHSADQHEYAQDDDEDVAERLTHTNRRQGEKDDERDNCCKDHTQANEDPP